MTMWFDRKPGESVAVGSDEESGGDPSTVLLDADAQPDWVRMPAALGSRKLKVLRVFHMACPMCEKSRGKSYVTRRAQQDLPPHFVRHLSCEEGFYVAECLTHGFVWYRVKESP